MTGSEAARRVVKEFGTAQVREIARNAGIAISSANWYPVTAGEFDLDAMEIILNDSATVNPDRTVAHELGHYFFWRYSIKDSDEERFCDDFADFLLAEIKG